MRLLYGYCIAFLLLNPVYAEDLNQFGCDFKDMEAFFLKELGVKGITIRYLIQRMESPELKGFARKLGKKSYLIAMAKGLEASEKRVTLAHELVHVRQMEEGSINKEEFEKHYLDRSFEDEAFRLSFPLVAKFYTGGFVS